MKINIFVLLFLSNLLLFAGETADLRLDPQPNRMNAIRFDPSYYYDYPDDIETMCENLVAKWAANSVNTIFYKAYDPVYGAKYKTDYIFNVMADYGRLDLLKQLLKAAGKFNMKVFAWIPAFQHKSAWLANPGWRVQLSPGEDYQPNADSYFLCPANSEVRAWWTGFLQDLLLRYPQLNGVDIAEPIISWNGNTCYCGSCRSGHAIPGSETPGTFTTDAFAQTLMEGVKLIQSAGKLVSVTTVASVDSRGNLLSNEQQVRQTGFDLNRLLSSESAPDIVSAEFMWQQWAERFADTLVFSPRWVTAAAKRMYAFVDGRARLIAHLERTSFGEVLISNEQFRQSIINARDAGIQDIDVYDSHLIDSLHAWADFKEAADYVPIKNVLLLYDSEGENDVRQVASLLSHFRVSSRRVRFDQTHTLKTLDFADYTHVFVVGTDQGYPVPLNLLKMIDESGNTICWINFGIEQLLNRPGGRDRGFRFEQVRTDSAFNTVLYKGEQLQKSDAMLNQVAVTDSSRVHVYSWLYNGIMRLPYILRSGRFWYIADMPTSYVVEGGRHIVFSDLLHDILNEDHLPVKLALVRIEDIHPLTDPMAMEHIADMLKSKRVPFSVAVVPYYMEPESNTTVAMSDRPEFIAALKEMQKAGGCIVMHGTTHQYRGETTADYEFWDMMADQPLFGDSREFVRQRLSMGLAEFSRNGIYPLVWETPHYGASQLDYSIINTVFGTAYERRQTVDLHGSDQLLPYLIYNHTAGGKIIPENLGYIPLSNPDPDIVLNAARKNLLVRDGVASFFFHTFVNHDVLEDIVSGIKEMGFQFTNPTWTANRVNAELFVQATGTMDVTMNLSGEYYGEYIIDQKYDFQESFISDSALTGAYARTISLPPGWIYQLRKYKEKPEGKIRTVLNKWLSTLSAFSLDELFMASTLNLSEGRPASAMVIVNPEAQGPESRSQENLIHALESVGINSERINVGTFLQIPESVNLVILPLAAGKVLNDQQILFLIRALQNGTNVIFEKSSRVTQNIGIYNLEDTYTTASVFDEYYPQVEMNWDVPEEIQRFDVDIDYVSYYSDREREEPVIIGGEYGSGKYLYLAALFDPDTDLGYGRFPFFIDMLKRQFDLVPVVRNHTVEIYFEPGSREDISIEDLIKIWRSSGVRRIHVSAWHFYEDYEYDYARLIDLAHKNAMETYAWLELPHVSQKFWDDHPDWREITATGNDAQIDWRRNMALDIPECRAAVIQYVGAILDRYDWDGVNLAELYYESPRGFSLPEILTPFNDHSRNLFRAEFGYDPQVLFDPRSSYYWKRNQAARREWLSFREDRIISLHEIFLRFISEHRAAGEKDWEIIVTTIDDTFMPETARNLGINTGRIFKLAEHMDFTMQIEDPQELWAMGPDRYSLMQEKYEEIHNDIPLIFDINVVPYRDLEISKAPTLRPTGTELYQAVRSASTKNNRVALYSEASLYDIDFPMIAYALSTKTQERFTDSKWLIDAEQTVFIQLNSTIHKEIIVDGKIWPAYSKGKLILPAGEHSIEAISRFSGLGNWMQSGTRLVDVSGELLQVSDFSRGLTLVVENRFPGRIIISKKPVGIELNTMKTTLPVLRGEQGYSIDLPAGRNDLIIYTSGWTAVIIKQASIILSVLIVFIGFGAALILVIIYIRNTIRRKFRTQYT